MNIHDVSRLQIWAVFKLEWRIANSSSSSKSEIHVQIIQQGEDIQVAQPTKPSRFDCIHRARTKKPRAFRFEFLWNYMKLIRIRLVSVVSVAVESRHMPWLFYQSRAEVYYSQHKAGRRLFGLLPLGSSLMDQVFSWVPVVAHERLWLLRSQVWWVWALAWNGPLAIPVRLPLGCWTFPLGPFWSTTLARETGSCINHSL